MKTGIFLLLIGLFFAACNNYSKLSENSALAEDADEYYEILKDEFVLVPASEQVPPKNDQSKKGENEIAITERKLIRKGEVHFEVVDIEKTRISITKICQQLNAYISHERQNNYKYRLQQTLEIRIPYNKYDSLIVSIEKEAYRVESKNIQVEDVTAEFIDVQARLKTKKEVEGRYIALLKQAQDVPDILKIEKQIEELRGDIESLEGRLKFLQDKVSYSTLTLTFYQVIGTNFGFGSKFLHALKQGWDNLLIFLIGLTHIWPFILIFSTSLWLGIRWLKKRKVTEIKVN